MRGFHVKGSMTRMEDVYVTLELDDELLAQIKNRAIARGQSLDRYVEAVLRREARGPEIPTFTDGTGMRADIDSSSNRALFDAMDALGELR